MSSSHTILKPFFNVAMEITQEGYSRGLYSEFTHYAVHTRSRNPPSPRPDELIGPHCSWADVAVGLPEFDAALDALHFLEGDTSAQDSCRVKVAAGVQGGLKGGETNLLAKKIATLVMMLEECLLLKLVAPSRGPRKLHPLRKESKVALGEETEEDLASQWPVSPDYNSHVPPTIVMKPAAWNRSDPGHMHATLQSIWSAPSVVELQYILCARFPKFCDFCFGPSAGLDPTRWWDLNVDDYGLRILEERPQDPTHIATQYDWSRERPTWFYFKHLQTTFKHALVRNWVEVVARVVELAQAGPDEYKRCLETIITILHDADQGGGGVTWEQLMKHVLKLEHRIPDWRDQIARYEEGEIIEGLSQDGLLPKSVASADQSDGSTTSLL